MHNTEESDIINFSTAEPHLESAITQDAQQPAGSPPDNGMSNAEAEHQEAAASIAAADTGQQPQEIVESQAESQIEAVAGLTVDAGSSVDGDGHAPVSGSQPATLDTNHTQAEEHHKGLQPGSDTDQSSPTAPDRQQNEGDAAAVPQALPGQHLPTCIMPFHCWKEACK